MQIRLVCENANDTLALNAIAKRWQLSHSEQSSFALVLTDERLELRMLTEPKLGAIYVDFAGGAALHRRKFGGGKGQAVAKAVGLNKGAIPTVLDATAGLGRDAFVLACLGCKVQMVERHPVVAALLENGLLRAQQDSEIGAWVSERMTLLHASSQSALLDIATNDRPDVVYLDPMFPHRKKSALVKKEMRIFQSLVGADEDANKLFEPAYELALKRVVVKRPDFAPFLADQKPSTQILTKKNRFDLYVKEAMR